MLTQSDKVLVSIIIPAYNCEKTIQKSIYSALSQDVPVEVLVIDDGSTDWTERIVQQYLDHPAVRYIKNETNIGAAKTRNRGVQLARGKYVAFLDSDDWWENNKLQKQLSRIETEKAVLCCTGRDLMNPDGSFMGKYIPVSEKITYRSLLKHNCINCSSVLLLRDAALEFPMEHEDSHEDYITWLKILKKYGYACGINEPLLKYRMSSTGKSGSKFQSACMTWKVYRYMGFGLLKSVLCFCSYAVHGLWKYR